MFKVASSANSGAAGAMSLTVTKPAGVVSGDLMIAGLVTNSTTVTVTPPSGWVLVHSIPNGTNATTRVYRKLAGGSEPATYVFGYSFNVKSAAAVAVTAQVAPSVAILSANAQVVRVWGVKKETTLTPPAGVTERADTTSTGTGSVTVEIGDVAQPGCWCVRCGDGYVGVGRFRGAYHVALKPAPGAFDDNHAAV